jgi:NAD(P)H-dependent FMN reductase
MAAQKSVAILTMSTRPVRIGPRVAEFVTAKLEAKGMPDSIALTSVDLATFKLPLFDEEVIPAAVQSSDEYKHAHSKAWSDEIRRHDGYILVIPEYNYGVAGATKNAIDYLKNEWVGKPAIIVSYGFDGGNFANDQAHNTLTKTGLRIAPTRPMMPFKGNFGPDAFTAMQGQLAAGTLQSWEEEQTTPILAAFEELKGLLVEKP